MAQICRFDKEQIYGSYATHRFLSASAVGILTFLQGLDLSGVS